MAKCVLNTTLLAIALTTSMAVAAYADGIVRSETDAASPIGAFTSDMPIPHSLNITVSSHHSGVTTGRDHRNRNTDSPVSGGG
jgi:hypothetical protein